MPRSPRRLEATKLGASDYNHQAVFIDDLLALVSAWWSAANW